MDGSAKERINGGANERMNEYAASNLVSTLVQVQDENLSGAVSIILFIK